MKHTLVQNNSLDKNFLGMDAHTYKSMQNPKHVVGLDVLPMMDVSTGEPLFKGLLQHIHFDYQPIDS